jgi:hypothetical protein
MAEGTATDRAEERIDWLRLIRSERVGPRGIMAQSPETGERHNTVKLLFADDASAMRWFTSPNRDLPFGGHSPLDRALRGSIDDLYAVRRYIDAWRGMK